MTEEKRETARSLIAEAIRKSSRAGCAVDEEALFARLKECEWPEGDRPVAEDMGALLEETLARNADLAVFAGVSGNPLYHAPALLSRTYASIMDRKSSPVMLIAEEVRSNSAEYPRPLPLALFLESPFDLTPDQIQESLALMAADPAFRDITYTTTSTGAVYLFSSRHLERPYAEFLAERVDVGYMVGP